ncbi:2'-5' RNA ligase family protein [Ureibacillus acetophenoni]|uniref:2'-5' RNA ligase n=1 Tax=Ureibacillus acetophenoni TaxID=614649 RepID=A0A285UIR4_9BACL|nr:2'-5' RNA ligase family protein [Ureibacillus acetophenoni]SOC41587.1 2'-5' RNA ligase [Ureibacillus acetophenoni]
MQYFIGIVPSDEYKQKVTAFQQKWKNHWITDVVEPHITVKAQGGLTPDKEWIRKVKKVCNQFSPFNISVSKPMFFGEDILYLSVNSKELYELHNKIVEKILPSDDLIKKYFELDDYIPHMTLGKTYFGLSKQDLNDMAKLAEEELTPYPTFEVNFIRIYQEVEPLKYVKLLDIPLSNVNFN